MSDKGVEKSQASSTVPEGYDESWHPIESDPAIFTTLARNLGLSRSLTFVDVLSLDSAYLNTVSRLCLALIIVYPTDDRYEETRKIRSANSNIINDSNILWFRQRIFNACGLYGLLHAVCNGEARDYICKAEFRQLPTR